MNNNELQHWGIKGMRWGIRRFQNKDGTLTPEGKKRYNDEPVHDDYKKVHDKKDVRYMSDAELRARNNRLQMEKQYQNMTKKTSKGKKAMDTFIKTAGTITAVTAAVKVYGKIFGAAADKIGDWVLSDIRF